MNGQCLLVKYRLIQCNFELMPTVIMLDRFNMHNQSSLVQQMPVMGSHSRYQLGGLSRIVG